MATATLSSLTRCAPTNLRQPEPLRQPESVWRASAEKRSRCRHPVGEVSGVDQQAGYNCSDGAASGRDDSDE